MAKYRFVAVSGEGKEVSGTVECGSEEEVSTLLKGKGMFPTSITEAGGAAGSAHPAVKRAAAPAAAKAPKQKLAKKESAGAPKPKPFSRPPKSASKAKKGGGVPSKAPGFMTKVKPKELMTVTRQLATLVDAGLPLVRGLGVLQRQEKNPFDIFVSVLTDEIIEKC